MTSLRDSNDLKIPPFKSGRKADRLLIKDIGESQFLRSSVEASTVSRNAQEFSATQDPKIAQRNTSHEINVEANYPLNSARFAARQTYTADGSGSPKMG
jgi:hypothetical protein